jgi:hypothetical protein
MEQGFDWAQFWPGRFGEKKSLFFLTGTKPRLIHNVGKSVHQLGYAGSQIDTVYLKGPFDAEFEYEI